MHCRSCERRSQAKVLISWLKSKMIFLVLCPLLEGAAIMPQFIE
jgi:hypothetical protein